MKAHDLEIAIDSLVIDGVSPGDGHRVGAAIRRELTRLVRVHGVPPGLALGGSLDRLDVGSIGTRPGMRPAAIGARVARAVYGGLRR